MMRKILKYIYRSLGSHAQIRLPEAADFDVLDNGTIVAAVSNSYKDRMDKCVRDIARTSGQRVEWCSAHGEVVIKAIGDIDRVISTIEYIAENDPRFNEMICVFR